jgi:hypothetical protein
VIEPEQGRRLSQTGIPGILGGEDAQAREEAAMERVTIELAREQRDQLDAAQAPAEGPPATSDAKVPGLVRR